MEQKDQLPGLWGLYVRLIVSCVLATAALTGVSSTSYILVTAMIEDDRQEEVISAIVGLIFFSTAGLFIAFVFALPVMLLLALICAPIWAMAFRRVQQSGSQIAQAAMMAALLISIVGWIVLCLLLRTGSHHQRLIEVALSPHSIFALVIGVTVSPLMARAMALAYFDEMGRSIE